MLKIDLSPEQLMLQDAARRYMSDEYGFQTRQRIVAADAHCDAQQWQAYADMGWLGLPFPEAWGGGNGTALDVFLLMQAFGCALAVEPYIPTVVMGGLTLLGAGRQGPAQQWIPRIVAGELQIACALFEPHSGIDPLDIRTSASPAGDHFLLNGHKAVVLGAPSADHFIVSAHAGGLQHGPDLSLFLVKRTLPGVALRSYRTIDGRRAAEVLLNDARVSPSDVLGGPGEAAPLLRAAAIQGTVALLGEAIGCLEGALAVTINHLNTREQFGQKLAKFQALRHRVADMFVAKEEARALCLSAAHTVAAGSPHAAESVSAAKAYVGRVGRQVCEEAVQLHGAIAITDEYIVGHYLKRMLVVDRMFGDADHHLGRYLDCRGDFDDGKPAGMEAET